MRNPEIDSRGRTVWICNKVNMDCASARDISQKRYEVALGTHGKLESNYSTLSKLKRIFYQ